MGWFSRTEPVRHVQYKNFIPDDDSIEYYEFVNELMERFNNKYFNAGIKMYRDLLTVADFTDSGKDGFGRSNRDTVSYPPFYIQGYKRDGGRTLWGLYDPNLNEVLKCEYDGFFSFRYGAALVKKNYKCGYIDAWGNELIPCKYEYVHFGKEDIKAEFVCLGEFGYNFECADITLSCSVIFDLATGKEVLRSEKGIILPIDFHSLDSVKPLIPYKRPFGRNTNTPYGCGYLNVDGSIAIPPIFKEVKAFHNGYAEVKSKEDNQWYIIDKNGRIDEKKSYDLQRQMYEDDYPWY